MLIYWKLKPQEQIAIKFHSKWKIFIHENIFESVIDKIAAISPKRFDLVIILDQYHFGYFRKLV